MTRCKHNWRFIRSEKGAFGVDEVFTFHCTRCLSIASLWDTRWEYEIDEAVRHESEDKE